MTGICDGSRVIVSEKCNPARDDGRWDPRVICWVQIHKDDFDLSYLWRFLRESMIQKILHEYPWLSTEDYKNDGDFEFSRGSVVAIWRIIT